MKNKIIIIIISIIVVITATYIIIDNNKEINILEKDEKNVNVCAANYFCEEIDGVIHSFSREVKLNSIEAYDYEKDITEVGSLEVTDNNLVFKDLSDKVIKTYDNIDGAVQYILKHDNCEEYSFYAITGDGLIYTADSQEGLLSEEPFHLIDSAYTFTDIEVFAEEVDKSICGNSFVLGKSKENKLINLIDDSEYKSVN